VEYSADFFGTVGYPIYDGNIAGKLSDLSAQRIQFNGHYVELAGHGTGGGRRFSGLDGENKRGCRILDLILGGPFPGRRRRFREPIALHCGTQQKTPGLGFKMETGGSCSCSRVQVTG